MMKGRTTGDRRGDQRDAAMAGAPERMARREEFEPSSERVSGSALTIAIAALGMPAWLLGSGAMFAHALQHGSTPSAPFVESALLLVGLVAIAFCARAASQLRSATPFRGSSEGDRLWCGAGAAAVAAAVFMQRALWSDGDLSSDPLALMGAVVPIFCIADLSRALFTATDGRFGTDAARRASYSWMLSAALLAVAALGLGLWWLPALLSCGAAASSAITGVCVWQRYQGVPATA